jgi:CMP-N-acetylneuraminic acid synthetase
VFTQSASSLWLYTNFPSDGIMRTTLVGQQAQRTGTDIDTALAALNDPHVQSVMSVYQVEDHHPGRMYQSEGGRLAPLFPQWIAARRQDLPPIYHRNGAIYACRVEHFKRTGFLWDERPFPYVMPRNRSLNIDDPFDFEIAEFIYSRPKG